MNLPVNFPTCAQKETKNIVKERRLQNIIKQDVHCLVFEMIPKCLKHTIKSCGCLTNKVATEIFYDLLSPHNCPAIEKRRVVCTSDGQKYKIDDFVNGSGRTNACMWILLLVSVFTVIVSQLF